MTRSDESKIQTGIYLLVALFKTIGAMPAARLAAITPLQMIIFRKNHEAIFHIKQRWR